jgi:ribonuclease PH
MRPDLFDIMHPASLDVGEPAGKRAVKRCERRLSLLHQAHPFTQNFALGIVSPDLDEHVDIGLELPAKIDAARHDILPVAITIMAAGLAVQVRLAPAGSGLYQRTSLPESMMRPSKRAPDELRKVTLERGVARYAEGSCLVAFGDTKVLCTASLEERGPPWLRGSGKGWVTAEYAMLPRATHERTRREVTSGKPSGRTHEIQRLIGRSLRAVCNLPAIGEKQVVVDCDVIQADGGTRTAAITGAWVALSDCFAWMQSRSIISVNPLREHVAAVSCGIHQGMPVLDLDYAEDSAAETDANFVITGSGGLVEVQGTAEGKPFSEEEFLSLMRLARVGVAELVALQKAAVAS